MDLCRWRTLGMLVLVALGLSACGVSDSTVVAETTADGHAAEATPDEPRRDIIVAPTEEIIPTATVESTVVPDTTSTATVSTPTVTNDASAMQSVGAGDTTTQSESPTPTFDENAGRVLLLAGTGQVELLLTNAQGRRLGYDPATATIFEEFPYAVYSRNEDESTAYVFIIGIEPGSYTITVTGIGTGNYDLLGLYEDADALTTLIYEEDSVTLGQRVVFDIDVPGTTAEVPDPPNVQLGRDMTAVVNQPVTFNGTFSDINPDDTHTITWDFGDGNSAGDTLTPTHTYMMSGVYTTTLTVDDNTGFVISDTLQVDVTAPSS